MKKFFLILIAVASMPMAGCASLSQKMSNQDVREIMDKDMERRNDELLKKVGARLHSEPAIVEVPVPPEAFVLTPPPAPDFGDREIKVSFPRTDPEMIVLGLAKVLDLNVISSMEGNSPAGRAGNALLPAQSTKSLHLNFKGKVNDLFATLSKTTGLFFVEENGSVLVKKDHLFTIVVPNYADIFKTVDETLKKLGARDTSYEPLTSTLTFTADYEGYRRISAYLQDIRDSVSLVSLKILLINVSMNERKNAGIDWGQIAYGYDKFMQGNLGAGISTDTTGGVTGGTTGGSTVSAGATGYGIFPNAAGASLLFQGTKFTLSTFLNFMEQYGNLQVMQNVFVETISGKKGKIEVVTETPFISNIGVASLSSGGGATGQTTNTETAKDGVTMDILPYYNRKHGTLTIDLKVAVHSVGKMIEMSAGNNGKFTRPEQTTKNLETSLRMRPDQVAVIGGLSLSKSTGNANGLPGESLFSKSLTQMTERQELAIVVRPTVVLFVPTK